MRSACASHFAVMRVMVRRDCLHVGYSLRCSEIVLMHCAHCGAAGLSACSTLTMVRRAYPRVGRYNLRGGLIRMHRHCGAAILSACGVLIAARRAYLHASHSLRQGELVRMRCAYFGTAGLSACLTLTAAHRAYPRHRPPCGASNAYNHMPRKNRRPAHKREAAAHILA